MASVGNKESVGGMATSETFASAKMSKFGSGGGTMAPGTGPPPPLLILIVLVVVLLLELSVPGGTGARAPRWGLGRRRRTFTTVKNATPASASSGACDH